MHFELPPESVTARNASKSVKSTRRPPTNTQEKRTAHRQQRNENYANKYLRDLRRSFDDSDEDNLGSLTPAQWMNSSIRFYLREGKLSNEDYEQYFLRIDANCDGRVSWDELVEYILLELTSMTGAQIVDSPITLNRSPVSPQVFQHKHRESIFQVIVSSWTDEYITASREAIKFWNPYPLTYKRKLPSPGPFSAICCFKNYQLLGVTTTTRTLCFYNLLNLEKLPIGLSASPSAKSIKSMNFDNALLTMKRLANSSIPLFNSPAQMIEATLTPIGRDEIKLIIGDDCGFIELYQITMPQRRTGTDYKIDRIVNYQLQHRTITQLSVIEEQNCYASSSQDGTLKFFTFVKDTIHVTKIFEAGSQILSFQFFGKQRVVAMCTMGNEPFIWSIEPVRRSFRLAGNFNSALFATEFVSSLGDRYVVTVTSKKEIKMYDSTNFGIRNHFLEVDYLPPENRITSVLFDKMKRILVTCCSYPIIWLEGEVEGPRGVTHQSPIVGVHYQTDFDQLLTVDSQANFFTWDYKNGKMKQMRTPHVDELSNTSIDQSGRRVITSTFTGIVSIYNPSSGGLISTIDMITHHPTSAPSGHSSLYDSDDIGDSQGQLNSPSFNQVSIMKHFTMNGRGFLMTAGYSRVVNLYRESVPSEFELINHFKGHTGDITTAVLDHNGWIISGSENGEIFEWPIDIALKPRKTVLADDTPIECMTIVDHFLFVGDSDGFLTVFAVPGLEEISQLKAHLAVVPYAVSAICSSEFNKILITGDNLGYIRLWKINLIPSFSLQPVAMLRAHDGEVTNLTMIGKTSKFFASAGYDLAVRIWESETLRLVGTLSADGGWDINNEGTWVIDPPVEGDPKHFENLDSDSTGQFQNLSSILSYKSMSNIVTSRSQIRLPSSMGLRSSRERAKKPDQIIRYDEDDGEDEEKLPVVHFDLESAKHMFDMIQTSESWGYGTNGQLTLDCLQPPPEKKDHEITSKLQDDADVSDLLTKVKELQKKKFKTIDEYFPEMKDKKKQIYPSLTFA
ncbi:hypothetical protein M9Y10_009757 [Tritrichomonas musculus]|uniref:EF-hand domain-containing protein n=1 Tax=Tritrichomonas musculus TaxID=1915356 RepID=A0ABR2IP93_9EUKA